MTVTIRGHHINVITVCRVQNGYMESDSILVFSNVTIFFTRFTDVDLRAVLYHSLT